MKTIKVSELTGAALDWAVAKAEGRNVVYHDGSVNWPYLVGYSPSTDWAQGGPIIAREMLDVFCYGNGSVWDASTGDRHPNEIRSGLTPLIAAMRCYVASKLGDSVEIPEELL